MIYNYGITITNNTHPSKEGGMVDQEVVFQILNKIGRICIYSWELNQQAQLHVHATLEVDSKLYLKKLLLTLKNKYPNYQIRLDKLKTQLDLQKWNTYIQKHKQNDVCPLYYRLCNYYRCDDDEDFSELADHDIEYNRKTKHFTYKDGTKSWFLDKNL